MASFKAQSGSGKKLDQHVSTRGQRKSKLVALRKLVKTELLSVDETSWLVPNHENNVGPKIKLGQSKLSQKRRHKQAGSSRRSTEHARSSFRRNTSGVHALRMNENISVPAEIKLSTGNGKPRGPRCISMHRSALPSKSRLEKWLSPDVEIDEDEDTPRWTEGHMLWGKIRGYPYWPCMVSKDPFSRLFMRTAGTQRLSRCYHVQFFGVEAERSWLNEASLLDFEGREKYLDIVQFGLENPQNFCKSPSEFRISEAWYPAWSLAVAEAEGAFKLSVEERKLQYTFTYMLVKGDKQKPVEQLLEKISKRYNGQTGSDESDLDSDDDLYDEIFNEKRERPWYDSDDFYSSDDSLDFEPRKSRRPVKIKVRQGSFQVFTAKHAKFIQRENPEWDEPEILQHLWQQWSHMSYKQRSRYVSKYQKPVCMEIIRYKKQNFEGLADANDVDPYKLDLEILKLSNSPADVSSVDDLSAVQGLDDVAEPACQVCGGCGPDMKQCAGPCGQQFHTLCVPHETTESFICPRCKFDNPSDHHMCFLCKAIDGDTRLCSHPECVRFYHEACVGELKLTWWDKDGFVCPLHTCLTCEVGSIGVARQGPFWQCLLCPTAYHSDLFCVAAGAKFQGGDSLVCPAHFKPVKSLSLHSAVNVKRCFTCGNAGNLLLCQACPAAYHEDCAVGGTTKLPIIQRICAGMAFKAAPPKRSRQREPWLCGDCSRGRRPLYGDIVWIKLGFYRWWPGEVCQPQHVPPKVRSKAHQAGEFPVRFFGSQDFAWIHQGRVYPFDQGSREIRDTCMTNLDAEFLQGVKEATVAARLCASVREMRKIGGPAEDTDVKTEVDGTVFDS